MLPPLRDGLLQAPLPADECEQAPMFAQFQLQLASLLHSSRASFHPWGFCRSFRDYDGQCLEPHTQRDADEFLHELFDHLEQALAGGAQKQLLDVHFGGSLSQQLLWRDERGLPQQKAREESFRVLQLPLTDSVEDSLAAFVKGDTLQGENGYVLDDGSRVDALKRECLGTLPRVLIIQARRPQPAATPTCARPAAVALLPPWRASSRSSRERDPCPPASARVAPRGAVASPRLHDRPRLRPGTRSSSDSSST